MTTRCDAPAPASKMHEEPSQDARAMRSPDARSFQVARELQCSSAAVAMSSLSQLDNLRRSGEHTGWARVLMVYPITSHAGIRRNSPKGDRAVQALAFLYKILITNLDDLMPSPPGGLILVLLAVD
jgi:hypothetical protein